jgi:hypothetical protein
MNRMLSTEFPFNGQSFKEFFLTHDNKEIKCKNKNVFWKKRRILFFFRSYRTDSTIFTNIPLTVYPRRGSRDISDILPIPTYYQNELAMRYTVVVTGDKPIAVCSQSISVVSFKIPYFLCILWSQLAASQNFMKPNENWHQIRLYNIVTTNLKLLAASRLEQSYLAIRIIS